MTRNEGKRSDADGAETPGRRGGWRMVLLWASIVLMVLGGALTAYSWVRGGGEEVRAPAEGGGALDPTLVRGFLPTNGDGGEGDATATEAAADPLAEWSPAVFRLGFSFFAAFSIAYAARRFLRIAIVAAGLVFVILFGLQYSGMIDVNWNAMGDRFDGLSARLGEQVTDFTRFIQGYLPSAASAAVGLVAGFRSR